MKALGILLKNTRKKRGLSQHRLAALSGISRSEIDKVERGERQPKAATIAKLAQALSENVEPLVRAALDDRGLTRRQFLRDAVAAAGIAVAAPRGHVGRRTGRIPGDAEHAQDWREVENQLTAATCTVYQDRSEWLRRHVRRLIAPYEESKNQGAIRVLSRGHLALAVSYADESDPLGAPLELGRELLHRSQRAVLVDAWDIYHSAGWLESVYLRKESDVTRSAQALATARGLLEEVIDNASAPLRVLALSEMAKIGLSHRDENAVQDWLTSAEEEAQRAMAIGVGGGEKGDAWMAFLADHAQVYVREAKVRAGAVLGGKNAQELAYLADEARSFVGGLSRGIDKISLNLSLAQAFLSSSAPEDRATVVPLLRGSLEAADEWGHHRQSIIGRQLFRRAKDRLPRFVMEKCRHCSSTGALLDADIGYVCYLCSRPIMTFAM